ncbi:MAG: polysaccharide deacetylase family protein [Campylobacterota bacterium]|nr:polysaccharide deacetylase family protein [Campylobacterota bacterium]
MTWKQMRILKENGAEFANHSSSHNSLLPLNSETNKQWEKRISLDIQTTQLKLQKELGTTTNINPPLFSYPYGEYNTKIAKLIKKLGYIGVTQTSGAIDINSDLKILNRFPMAEAFASSDSFITKLNTLPLPIESVSLKEPILKDENPPSLSIKLKQPLKNIACYLSSGESIKIKWISKIEFEVKANKPLKSPREKYTCTAPTKDGKWYWYSHLWIIKK